MCWRSIPSTFTKFSQPIWQEFDPRQRMDLAISMKNRMQYLWLDSNRPNQLNTPQVIKTEKESVASRYEYNHDRWFVTNTDINNDGHADMLVKHRSGRCNPYPPESLHYEIPVMVVDSSGKGVDVTSTRQILNKEDGGILGVPGESFDLFSYDGKTYVDHWKNYGEHNGKVTHDKTLSIYLNIGPQRTLVCQFRLQN